MVPLKPFVFVHNNEIISPPLVTIRNYGEWFESYFDDYTVQMELYLWSKKKDGESVLEAHPGTRIGQFFKDRDFAKPEYYSWYISQDSTMMEKLRKYKLAEYKDAIPISVNDEQGRRMLRVYTLSQIELYIKMKVDKNFSLSGNYESSPRQIKIRENDLNKLIKPEMQKRKRTLF